MPNRIQSSTTRPSFGLIAWLEQTKISLPLKGVECRFAVCGDLLSVEIDQIFHQNSSRPLDCLYTFPLPGSAAVYRCEMHVNDRVIRARVEETERAREIVREKKAAGHRTALVEMERENLFTLSLGNVQPEDVVVIRFAYFQTLTRLADWTSFTIPFCPGVRYIPGAPLLRAPRGRGVADDTDQVPDAPRISPPRIDRLHPDAAYLAVEGTVGDALGQVRDITSPTHPVLVRDGAGAATITIADRAAVPDGDFVLRWTNDPVGELKTGGWLLRDGKESFALVRLQAPSRIQVADDHAQDVYFLLDRSGSMQGVKWQKTAQAFREFVKTLGGNDRVWATFFETNFSDFAEKPLPPLEVLQDHAVQNLEALGTGGGTELLPALQHVLEKIEAHSVDRPASLLLITDGQVGNEREILVHLRRHPNLRVHTFGIDTAVNDAFLAKMAAQQRGTSYLMAPSDDIAGAVARLGERLRRPVLTSIRAQDGWESADETLPDLHSREFLSVPLKGHVGLNQVVLEGKLPDGTKKSYHFDLVESDLPALRLLWAKRRIERCLAKEDKQAALALAKTHNLICEGASFVAWDEAEKVAVSAAGDVIYQPSLDAEFCCLVGGAGVCSDTSVADILGFSGSQNLHPARRLRTFESRIGSISLKSGKIRPGKPEEPRRTDDGAKVLQDVATFRTALVALSPFATVDARSLIDLLCEWVRSDATQSQARLAMLDELRSKLESCPAADPPARLDVVRQWIEVALKDCGSYLKRARELLHRMQSKVAV